jgi:hypothetical protein
MAIFILTIYKALGNKVDRFSVQGAQQHYEIDLGNESQGIYFIEYEGNNTREVKKLVLN